MADLSLERIAEIERGCEGVTPGPWGFEQTAEGMADMRVFSDRGMAHRHGFTVALVAPQQEDFDAAHIARLDPATVLALCSAARKGIQSPGGVRDAVMARVSDAVRDLQYEHERRQREEYEAYVARLDLQAGAIETTYRRVTDKLHLHPEPHPALRPGVDISPLAV